MKFSNRFFNTVTIVLFVVVASSVLFTNPVQAVTGRHPTGVNINANGVSTVLITFQNLAPNEVPVDAFWCGDVTASGVVVGTNPCVPGTLLGHLPRQFDLSTITGGATPLPAGQGKKKSFAVHRNLTDVMSIPIAVIRRAYQQAKKGDSSEFFYVRQFENNGVMTYVTVTCRMGGGGARTPLALTKVDLDFEESSSRRSITLVKQNEQLPEFSAQVNFTGAGLLKGRWEIVLPGDVEPALFDLLSEASLAPEQRPLQKRYRLISRFQKFLAPNGQTVIEGPDPRLLPTTEKGAYRILLRIEASRDVESISNTLVGNLDSGGVAGFPMPTLRYFVGDTAQYEPTKKYAPVSLLLPMNKEAVDANQVMFSWFGLRDNKGVASYKIEFFENNDEKKMLASSILKPDETSYKPVKTVLMKLNNPFIWRVVAMDKEGKVLSSSKLRQLSIRQQD